MKSFGKYIAKHLVSFALFLALLFLVNTVSFGWTFYNIIIKDYGSNSPQNMLAEIASEASLGGLSSSAAQQLRHHQIWALFLNQSGQCVWSVDAPAQLVKSYTVQDVAVFAKGYLADYPVFVWNTTDGLLVLGYPKDSYTKLTSNYFSIHAIQTLPLYFSGMLAVDLLLLFLLYTLSKRKILQNTSPIITGVEALSNGKPVSLVVRGELSEVAESVNQASQLLSKQNEARANWISGVSHDIRTPLSMIMGYAGRILESAPPSSPLQEQATIIQSQSIKIKELVQDLNLVSQLEYEMQPLHRQPVRLSKLLRSNVAELFNAGLPELYSISVSVAPAAEAAVLDCDPRLISRAISNLVQNSINHNPQGCAIELSLACSKSSLALTVADDGVGLSAKKLADLKKHDHYLNSTDEKLNLRHGLGLLLIHQIVEVHGGNLQIISAENQGFTAILTFQKQPVDSNQLYT